LRLIFLETETDSLKALSGYQQQDAHEYFQELLDHLHVSSGCGNNGKDTKNCGCLYHQIFFGTLRSTITCLSCRNQTVTEDPIVDLSLDLRQQANKRRKLTDKDSKGQSGKHNQEEAPLELTQCLKSFTTPEKLAPDSYNCRSKECGSTAQRARKHLTIRKLPPTLCIQLKVSVHLTRIPN
jgi:ubiquitin carboxyl-terminal hydrolase 22/27/51